MISYIIYNKRSCVTGKALFDSLVAYARENNLPLRWRRSNRTGPNRSPEAVIRWGSSLHEVNESNIPTLNSQEAVRNASNKLNMIDILSEAEGVRTPQIAKSATQAVQIADSEGNVYIRDRNDHVRYASARSFRPDDKYALEPINKQREFRVHVVGNSTVGIYEKIPNDSTVRIYKNDNCQFRRLDQSSDEAMQGLKGNSSRIGLRPMAKAAVAALGLSFGGVDVLMGENGQFYINEVNTAPGLNTENLMRWAEVLTTQLLQSDESGVEVSTNEQVDSEEQASVRSTNQNERVESNPTPEQLRTAEIERLRRRVLADARETVEAAGFTLTGASIVIE